MIFNLLATVSFNKEGTDSLGSVQATPTYDL